MGYNKKEAHRLWHNKNRIRQLQRMKEWRLKNQERVIKYRKQHHIKNKERINQHKKEYRKLHPEKIKAYRDSHKDQAKAYHIRNRERILEQKRKHQPIYYQKNKQKIAEYNKQYRQRPEVKARRNLLARIRRRNNPKSNRSASYDLQDAMNNARIRDKNTCQWQGCGLTFRQVPIHVHHIFPRNEYPELELIEQYMICYCANHHGMFHRARGDKYSEMIPARYQERGIIDYQEALH